MRTRTTFNVKNTQSIARDIAKTIKGGDVLALVGDLGAGKTTFVQGLAKALGITGPVKSPTFVRVVPYAIRNKQYAIRHLVHVDAYRVNGVDELRESGLLEYLERDDVVTVIEWADRIKKLLPKKRTKWMYFEVGKKEGERIVSFTCLPAGRS